ncbi:uncharacterized protein LOC141639195 isoform X2 [Silene latifolia]|uniref:uncharacterized protein LOC141639195 isoform X2 n=1 Tax=Silene latifolia TaxID=37657 RepID=UPI003D773403
MTCENEEVLKHGEELMEIDTDDANNGCITRIQENGLLLWPVLPQEEGEGLPFAPVDWPSPGDVWGWRVGKRLAASGFYLDRYLYLPIRFQKARRKRDGFASKLSVEHYVRSKFPGKDVNAFFSSFSWKIPSKQAYLLKGLKDEHGSLHVSYEDMTEQSPSNSMSGITVCKAGNRYCSSVVKEEVSPFSATQSCDVCCSELGFCRECCCILCCNTIDLSFGGYSFIRCEAIVGDGLKCGHAAHVNCALRSYMAGTVGGSVGLDTEYYCRRCDSRTDLTDHVSSFLRTCESIGSRDDVEKILNVGFCILRGSQKKGSQKLLNHIESVLQKLKSESELKEIWKADVDIDVLPDSTVPGKLDDMNHTFPGIGENNFQHENEYLKLDDEIDGVLNELRKAQEQEFRIAQEKLLAQKDNIRGIYKCIQEDKKELIQPTPSTNCDELVSSILVREEFLRLEFIKLKEMEKIGNGFGRTPKTLLKEHFDIDLEDRLFSHASLKTPNWEEGRITPTADY